MRSATRKLFLSAGFALIAWHPAHAGKPTQSLPSWALKTWNETKGPAAAGVFNYAKRALISCYEGEREMKCSLASRVDAVSIYYSAPDNAPDYAFVVIYFEPDNGNALWYDAGIFRRTPDGRYIHLRRVTGLIGAIDNAKLDQTDFIVTTATLMPDDSRCCPSGRTIWRVSIGSGQAKYLSGYRNPEWRLQ